MAENKKSFILYTDLIHTVKKMKKENAGELFLHILQYVNDENPQTDNEIVDLVFEPIKQQMKRDLKSWEQSLIDKSIAGRMGNLKRWNLDLYNKVLIEEIELEEAENIAKVRRASVSDKNDTVATETIAEIAVTVTDTVNVTVTDIKKENNIPEFSEFLAYAKEKEPSIKESSLKNKYDAWIENGWKNGNDRKIKNWKSSLLQTMPYLEKNGKSTNEKTAYEFDPVRALKSSGIGNS